MACHKVLIDYAEYLRLLQYQAKFEKDSKNKTTPEILNGGGNTNGEKTQSFETPLMGVTESITLPPSALQKQVQAQVSLKKKKKKKKTLGVRKWYFLGIP